MVDRMEDDSIATFALDDDRKESGEPFGPPTDSSLGSLPLYKCEMCRKDLSIIEDHYQTPQSHHSIPIWLDGVGSDIIEVCRSCHKRADERFRNLINDPFGIGKRNRFHNKRKMKFWYSNCHHRTVNRFNIDSACITTTIKYNGNTNHVVAMNHWYWPDYKRRERKTDQHQYAVSPIRPEVGVTIMTAIRYNKRTESLTVNNMINYRGNRHRKNKIRV